MSYDPNIHTSNNPAVNPLLTQTKAGQVRITQAYTTPTFQENAALLYNKEIQGGVHDVEYMSLLHEDCYAGIMSNRRRTGMLVFIRKDDAGNVINELRKLVNYPGTNPATRDVDWLPVGTAVDVDLTNRVNVATISERDNIPVNERDFVNVADAREPFTIQGIVSSGGETEIYFGTGAPGIQEGFLVSFINITGSAGMENLNGSNFMIDRVRFEAVGAGETIMQNTVVRIVDATTQEQVDLTGETYTGNGELIVGQPFSQSFVWSDNENKWLHVYGAGNIRPEEVQANTNARHTQNTDTHLDQGGTNELSAASIKQHLQNPNIHFEINDAADENVNNQVYSAAKVREIEGSLATEIQEERERIDDIGQNLPGNASTTSKGVVQEATQAQVNNGTASGTEARLFVNPSRLVTWLQKMFETLTITLENKLTLKGGLRFNAQGFNSLRQLAVNNDGDVVTVPGQAQLIGLEKINNIGDISNGDVISLSEGTILRGNLTGNMNIQFEDETLQDDEVRGFVLELTGADQYTIAAPPGSVVPENGFVQTGASRIRVTGYLDHTGTHYFSDVINLTQIPDPD